MHEIAVRLGRMVQRPMAIQRSRGQRWCRWRRIRRCKTERHDALDGAERPAWVLYRSGPAAIVGLRGISGRGTSW